MSEERYYKFLGPGQTAVLDLSRDSDSPPVHFEVSADYVDRGHGFSVAAIPGLVRWCVASMGQLDLVLWSVDAGGSIRADTPFDMDGSCFRVNRIRLLQELGVVDAEVRRHMAEWLACALDANCEDRAHPDADQYRCDPSDFQACLLIMNAPCEMVPEQRVAFGSELLRFVASR